MNTICLVLDRWHAGYLGPYGNAWIETPSIDRLAAQSFLFDQCFLDCPRLESLYRSYWYGWHPLHKGEPPSSQAGLPALLTASGLTTTLITDDPAIVPDPASGGFGLIEKIESAAGSEVAEDIDQTHLARCFARIVDWLGTASEPFFLWGHLAGLGTLWDAPLEFRFHYREEGDPQPPLSAEVPSRLLEKDFDPDEVLGYQQAYAGQISLLDQCLGGLLEFLDTSSAGRETLLVVLSARGFPLGEHRRLGGCDEALYEELIHTALFLRFPDVRPEAVGAGAKPAATGLAAVADVQNRCAAARSQALAQPADLWATLLDWHGIADRPAAPWAGSLLPVTGDEADLLHDRLCLIDGSGNAAIRTPAWYLREGTEPELYAKPDDRWEANNVVGRCDEVVQMLRRALADYIEHLRSGHLDALPPLEEVLRIGLE
jgi:hypothetical protein